MKPVALVFALAMLSISLAHADTTDDAIKLVQSGVAETVLEAWAQRQQASISAQDILRMKDAKVPDQVIAILLRNQPRESRVATQSIPVSYVAPSPTPTYVEPQPTYVYYSVPYYYGYPAYRYGYYPSWGVGLNFNFGHGFGYYHGARGWGLSGYRGGFSHHR